MLHYMFVYDVTEHMLLSLEIAFDSSIHALCKVLDVGSIQSRHADASIQSHVDVGLGRKILALFWSQPGEAIKCGC